MSPVEFGVASRLAFVLYQNLKDKRLKEKFCCCQEKDIFFKVSNFKSSKLIDCKSGFCGPDFSHNWRVVDSPQVMDYFYIQLKKDH